MMHAPTQQYSSPASPAPGRAALVIDQEAFIEAVLDGWWKSEPVVWFVVPPEADDGWEQLELTFY